MKEYQVAIKSPTFMPQAEFGIDAELFVLEGEHIVFKDGNYKNVAMFKRSQVEIVVEAKQRKIMLHESTEEGFCI